MNLRPSAKRLDKSSHKTKYKHMKWLDAERLRKYPGLDSLSDVEAQKVIDSLHSLAMILIKRELNATSKFRDEESELIEPKDSDDQHVRSKRK
ncbi:MAG TPA: hypothetical protein VFE50_08775 [Cyclobacteriaceae bacterium]|nr:hypothetical protein [Cyclobacteriaceae bacterium]